MPTGVTTKFAYLALVACLASTPALLSAEQWQEDFRSKHKHPEDPWENWNRKVFKFNDTLDTYALKPVAKGYGKVTPKPVRRSVRNFFGNLGEPKNLVNNLLQGKPSAAGTDISRFMLNTTFGLLGLFDVASKMGLERSSEDFGQTLGKWGVGSGPYVVLPLLGPSTMRDAPALIPDTYTTIYPYMSRERYRYGLAAGEAVSLRESLLSAESFLGGAGDKYTSIRSVYLQNREYRVRDGEVDDEF